MSRVIFYKMNKKQREGYLDEFYSAIETLKTKKEINNFFKDLLTPDEAIMLARRLRVAALLMSGKTVREIIEIMGVGSTTVRSVTKWLNRGFGGYSNVVSKLNQYQKSNKKISRKKIESDMGFTFDSLRKKYPAHFLLLNMFVDKKD